MRDQEPAATGEQPGAEAIAVVMRQWRVAHPHATLTEIEQELDRQWRTLRAALLGQLAPRGVEDLGACSTCGAAMIRRGQQTRTLRTDGDQSLVLRRAYASCPVCGHGVFPPG